MKKNNLTYENSGVNIKAADNFVKYISSLSKKRRNINNYQNIGGFGSITNIPKTFNNPKLVASTDGVGTKIEIANEIKKFTTIGIDLVAMCVNDLIVQGARPLIFLDYISINKINLKKLKQIIKGINKGCKISNCELVGGETAEMPGTYSKGKFDIAGFSVGVVDKNKILDKSKVRVNDLILAIPSNGVHSNGFSLIRHILKKKKINLNKNKFLKKELIKPTKIYVVEILNLINKNLINGCAHITGGGIRDNIKRILPSSLSANINLDKIKPNPIFKWIHSRGVNEKEMIKTFNCGVGFCIIINPKNLKKIKKYFSKNFQPYFIGKIINGKKNVNLNGKIEW
ncbi:phosphoribosylformylglycinamidine cyclo-ligase [Candidatus Pelagibacter sp.]|nr:phosphoribosylformylglycinamidine cyclo-ligase [Candidatus Pelagibacter sp.]